MNPVDITSHIEVFSPDKFGGRRIDVIGAGATGSRVVLELVRLGLDNIHVWDFDVVEAHNIGNQAYGVRQIGMPKVEALRDFVHQQTGVTIVTHLERVDGSQELGHVVFLLTDTMSSRKQIWEERIAYSVRTQLMIETRMGADIGRVYTVDPNNPAHVRGWENCSQYGDDVAEVSTCGSTTTVGPTAGILADLAVWQLIRWLAIEHGYDDKLDNEILFGLRPLYTEKNQFT